MTVLLSSPHQSIFRDALSFIRECLLRCSTSNRLILISSKLFHGILSTPDLRDLSVIGDQDILKVNLAIFSIGVWLSSEHEIHSLSTTLNSSPESIRNMVLHQVLIPIEPSLLQIGRNRHLWSLGDESENIFRLLSKIFEVSAFHQPTLNFVCSSRLPMVFKSLLSKLDSENTNQFITRLMTSNIRTWKANGSESCRGGMKLLQALEREGFRDAIEQAPFHTKIVLYGHEKMGFSFEIMNFLGMNSLPPGKMTRDTIRTQSPTTTIRLDNRMKSHADPDMSPTNSVMILWCFLVFILFLIIFLIHLSFYYSPFMNWNPKDEVTADSVSPAFISLISMVRDDFKFSEELLQKALTFLSSIIKNINRSYTLANDLLKAIGPDSPNPAAIFVDSIFVLVSSPHQSIVKASLTFIRKCLITCSFANRLALVSSKPFPRILSTPHLRDLSIIEYTDIVKVILALFKNGILLTLTESARFLSTTSNEHPQSIRDVVLNEVLIPIEPSLVQISPHDIHLVNQLPQAHLLTFVSDTTDQTIVWFNLMSFEADISFVFSLSIAGGSTDSPISAHLANLFRWKKCHLQLAFCAVRVLTCLFRFFAMSSGTPDPVKAIYRFAGSPR
ncbi:hypothetical protein BLNAU_20505 [Blattamonas nauphoetae]|uniref:Uncharacterized protein n=1 Tax=Blattamonas nauphoetae TaxID=2049346 RepID=A0ABQ9WYF7_9EUKA|nr:hypothetical protein BLNAU_20505 [Blattamonas nauphoetae]